MLDKRITRLLSQSYLKRVVSWKTNTQRTSQVGWHSKWWSLVTYLRDPARFGRIQLIFRSKQFYYWRRSLARLWRSARLLQNWKMFQFDTNRHQKDGFNLMLWCTLNEPLQPNDPCLSLGSRSHTLSVSRLLRILLVRHSPPLMCPLREPIERFDQAGWKPEYWVVVHFHWQIEGKLPDE